MRLFDPDEPADPGRAATVREPDSPNSLVGTPLSEDLEAAPSGPLRRVMLLVAYDGTDFHGFAAQRGIDTVGGRLSGALARVARQPVVITCAGRTDSGVHAAGQVVHAEVPQGLAESDLSKLVRSLNRQLGPRIAVLDAQLSPEGFDARRSAISRRYRYLLCCSPVPDPLLARTTWHVGAGLDLAAMRIAADSLLGEHDFSAFCRRPSSLGGVEHSLVRNVTQVQWTTGADRRLLAFEIEANAFCHQMVRSVVGALVSVGEGRLTAAQVFEILGSRDRQRGSRLAPPGGLCLVTVSYPEEFVPGGVWRPPGCLLA